MAKTVKKPASRVVSGSSKKSKVSKKLTLRLALFSLVGVLAFSVVAGLGVQKWQERQFLAKAGSWETWTYLGGNYGDTRGGQVKFWGCKTTINSAYGPLFKISVFIDNQNSWMRTGWLYNNKTNASVGSSSWYAGRYQQLTIYAFTTNGGDSFRTWVVGSGSPYTSPPGGQTSAGGAMLSPVYNTNISPSYLKTCP